MTCFVGARYDLDVFDGWKGLKRELALLPTRRREAGERLIGCVEDLLEELAELFTQHTDLFVCEDICPVEEVSFVDFALFP